MGLPPDALTASMKACVLCSRTGFVSAGAYGFCADIKGASKRAAHKALWAAKLLRWDRIIRISLREITTFINMIAHNLIGFKISFPQLETSPDGQRQSFGAVFRAGEGAGGACSIE